MVLTQVVKMIERARNQLAQARNLKFNGKLPRYETVYKAKHLKDAWILLNKADANYPASEFIKAVAQLKGNLSEKLDNLREERISREFELQETPRLIPIREDIDFDDSILLDDLQRLEKMQLEKEMRKRQNENFGNPVPYFQQPRAPTKRPRLKHASTVEADASFNNEANVTVPHRVQNVQNSPENYTVSDNDEDEFFNEDEEE